MLGGRGKDASDFELKKEKLVVLEQVDKQWGWIAQGSKTEPWRFD